METEKPHLREIRSFGRRDGRPLSKRQQYLVDTLLTKVRVPDDVDALTAHSLFGDHRPIWLEIGFGGAEHLIRMARQHPEIGFIGAEPFIDGVAKALTGIDENNLNNVRLYDDDVRTILPLFPKAAISRTFILFPDPWPKRRQQKRRLIQPAFLDELSNVMAPDAHLRFATDVASYADEALARFLTHPAFDWTAECANDWKQQPADHEATRYQLKKLGDCEPVWLEFIRRAD